jgi:hypothetical protein
MVVRVGIDTMTWTCLFIYIIRANEKCPRPERRRCVMLLSLNPMFPFFEDAAIVLQIGIPSFSCKSLANAQLIPDGGRWLLD